jgi:hypothetical protein
MKGGNKEIKQLPIIQHKITLVPAPIFNSDNITF